MQLPSRKAENPWKNRVTLSAYLFFFAGIPGNKKNEFSHASSYARAEMILKKMKKKGRLVIARSRETKSSNRAPIFSPGGVHGFLSRSSFDHFLEKTRRDDLKIFTRA